MTRPSLFKGLGLAPDCPALVLTTARGKQLKIRKNAINQNVRIVMNHQFDELTKSLAQSFTRRAALKKFGLGLAGMALACLGLANKAEAAGSCESARGPLTQTKRK